MLGLGALLGRRLCTLLGGRMVGEVCAQGWTGLW